MQQPPGGGYPPGGGFPPGWPQGGDQGQQGGYGQPQQPQWGQQGYPQQGGFGAPQQPSQPGRPAGIDQTLAMPEMSAQPPGGPPGYGAPGYGAPQQQGGFGAPQQQGGFGAPPSQQGGFGAPQQGGFGAPQQGGFGAPQPGGFNPMQPAGGMIPAGMAPTAGADIPLQPGMTTQTMNLEYPLAALLSYVVGIVALIIIFTEPKEPQRRWIRFHAFQALFGWVALTIVATVLSCVLGILKLGFLAGLLWPVGWIGMIVVALKAKNGQLIRIPVVSGLADKYA